MERPKRVIQELYETEVSYLEFLKTLNEDFYQPLKSSVTSNEERLLDEESILTIFQNLPELIACNSKILKELRTECENTDHTPRGAENLSENVTKHIGEIFLRAQEDTELSLQDLYQEYINGYDMAVRCFTERLQSTRFAQFIEKQLQNRFPSVLSYLITPVQRLPRYIMLLTDLVKSVPETHPHHSTVERALQGMQEITKQVNEGKAIYEEEMRKEILFQSFPESDQVLLSVLTHPETRILRETSILLKRHGGKTSSSTRTLIILNNALICLRRKHKGGSSSLVWVVDVLTSSLSIPDSNPRRQQRSGSLPGGTVGVSGGASGGGGSHTVPKQQLPQQQQQQQQQQQPPQQPHSVDLSSSENSFIQVIDLQRVSEPPFIKHVSIQFTPANVDSETEWKELRTLLQEVYQRGASRIESLSQRVEIALAHLQKALTSSADWRVLEIGNAIQTFPTAGEVLVREGDRMKALFMVRSGAVEVVKRVTGAQETVVLATIGPGHIMGEISYLKRFNSARAIASASMVISVPDTQVLVIPYEKLDATLLQKPDLAWRFYFWMSAIFGGRLVRLDALFSAGLNYETGAHASPSPSNSIGTSPGGSGTQNSPRILVNHTSLSNLNAHHSQSPRASVNLTCQNSPGSSDSFGSDHHGSGSGSGRKSFQKHTKKLSIGPGSVFQSSTGAPSPSGPSNSPSGSNLALPLERKQSHSRKHSTSTESSLGDLGGAPSSSSSSMMLTHQHSGGDHSLRSKWKKIEALLGEDEHILEEFPCKFRVSPSEKLLQATLLVSRSSFVIHRKVFGRKSNLVVRGAWVEEVFPVDHVQLQVIANEGSSSELEPDSQLVVNFLFRSPEQATLAGSCVRNFLSNKKFTKSLKNSGSQKEIQLTQAAQLFEVAFGEECVYEKRATIVKQGCLSDTIYQLTSGSCRVVVTTPTGETLKVGRIREGEIFGELSFLLGTVTSASVVVSSEQVCVVKCSWENLTRMCKEESVNAAVFYKFLASSLCNRFISVEKKAVKS